MSLRVVFAGTPDFAVPSLAPLIARRLDVVAVFTQPDRPSGRGRKLKPGPVKQLALDNRIAVLQPTSLKGDAGSVWRDIDCDLAIVAAYGLILPLDALNAPRLGCINVHASLLPRWRGAAPINRAIEAGDSQTGVTLMQMDAGLDTGAMLAKVHTEIDESSNAITLHDTLAALGAQLLDDSLDAIVDGQLTPQAQSERDVTYAAKLSRAESPIDWRLDAQSIDNKIRALVPWPCANATHNDTVLKLHDSRVGAHSGEHGEPGTICAIDDGAVHVACGGGTLALRRLQRPGSRAPDAREFLNGYPLRTGERFNPAVEAASA